MKIIIIPFLLLFYTTHSLAQNDSIEKAFTKFQTALLKENCEKLAAISSFPIIGDIGLARLIEGESLEIDMKKYNYEISKELLLQNCRLLNFVELQVLQQFPFTNATKKIEIEYEGCIYKAYLFIAEDSSYFQWSVGCVELLNEAIGEYSIIFTFKRINGVYKLKQIYGAG